MKLKSETGRKLVEQEPRAAIPRQKLRKNATMVPNPGMHNNAPKPPK